MIAPANSTATVGNTLILVCVGYGVPAPEMAWLRDGEVLVNGSRVTVFTEPVEEQGVNFTQTTLEICSLDQEQDAGTYYCRASNEYGTDQSAFEITVEPIGQ